jgi:putative FmdB family regulatory protein
MTAVSPMPTYEYICKSCGNTFDVFQSFSDRPLRKHSGCGGEVQKVFHASGVVFRGSGFYATDSRSSSAKEAASNGSSTAKEDKKEKKDTTAKTAKKEKAPSSSKPSPD